MSRFIESICLREGKFHNLELHEQRMQRALASVHSQRQITLVKLLPTQPPQGWFKCRILYDENGEDISIEKYQPRPVASLKVVHDNTIEYSHKYFDRSQLEKLFSLRGQCDDVLIIKNGKVTDSLYANLAFKKEDQWFTPETYLLPGIMREKLAKDKAIQPTEITLSNIHTFEKVKLINALVGFDAPELEIKNIVF